MRRNAPSRWTGRPLGVAAQAVTLLALGCGRIGYRGIEDAGAVIGEAGRPDAPGVEAPVDLSTERETASDAPADGEDAPELFDGPASQDGAGKDGASPDRPRPDASRPDAPLPDSGPPLPAPTALLGHWSFDDGSGLTARDESGAGHDALLRGTSPPTWSAGHSGGALQFDGRGGWARAPFSALDDTARNNRLTLTAWVYRTAQVPDWFSSVASRQSGDSVYEHFALTFFKDHLQFMIETEPGTAPQDCTTQAEAPLNRWMHLAGTFDGQTARLYVDGREVCSFARPVALRPDTTPLAIGANVNTNDPDAVAEGFIGLIDDLRLYARTLTAAEIGLLVTAGR